MRISSLAIPVVAALGRRRTGMLEGDKAWKASLLLWSAVTASGLLVLARRDSFWVDELTSYWFSSGDHIASVVQRMIFRNDPHPPGYQLLLFVFYQIPGVASDAIGARSLSIVSYLVGLFSGVALLRRTTSSYAPALVYAVVFGSASYVTFYATELRSYMSQQAALMALLLMRNERTSQPRAYLHILEQLAAFYLGFSHYVASLMVGVLAACGGIRAARKGPTARAALPEAGYLLGPVASTIWLLSCTDRENFRKLDIPSAREIALYFVNAIGEVQFVLLFVLTFVALCMGLGRSRAGELPLAPFLVRTGVVEALLAFILLLVLLPVRPALQERNVLLFLPPLLCALSTLLVSALRGRGNLVLGAGLLLIALAGFSSYGQELRSPERFGSDFLKVAELADTRPVVVATEDLRRKVLDAGVLHTPSLDNLKVIALRSDPAQAQALLERDGKIVLACPHCRDSTRRRLEQFQRANKLHCKKKKTAARDVMSDCR